MTPAERFDSRGINQLAADVRGFAGGHYYANFPHYAAALDELVALVGTLQRDNQRWLAWSKGVYPDDSPGDVISAETDGTIVLDDGITTWNPLRALEWFAAQVGTLQQERDAERRWCKHWAERAEAAEAELVKRPTLEEAVANVNFWKDKAVAAEAALAAGDQGERLDGTGRVAPADGCAERQSTADPSPAASAGPDTPADSQEDKT